jgi:FMN phosphatase YigB (HAD superfamily)
MRILYYLEPLIEQQNPYFRVGAIKNTIIRQAKNLQKQGHDISIFTSVHVYNKCVLEGVDFTGIQVFKVTLPEVLQYYSNSMHSAMINYRCHEADTLTAFEDLYKNTLGDYLPETIISWESPNNVLKNLFKDTPCIHMMPGFFSRVPFPELTFIDPCGFFEDSALVHFRGEIQKYSATIDELALVENIKTTFFRRYLSGYSPFSREKLDPEGKFEKLLLLPLQVSGYFAFDFHTEHNNQMDFLVSVLSQVPENVGVVVTQYVTQHSKDTPINKDTLEFLQGSFSNLIFDPLFDRLDGVSQYLLPYVDGVISASSSIAFQAAFLELPIYMYGTSHISIVAETFKSLVDNGFKLQKRNQDSVLAFILTRMMPLTINNLYEGDWLHNYILKNKATYNEFLNLHNNVTNNLFQQLSANSVHCDMKEYTSTFIDAGKPHVAISKLNSSCDKNLNVLVNNKNKTFKALAEPEIDIVSFDIFDTLVVRPFAKPIDLFRYIEDKVYDITDGAINEFTQCRMKSEQAVKKRLKELNDIAVGQGVDDRELTYEITIDQIYGEMSKVTNFNNKVILNAVKTLEIETEIDLLYPRQSGVELFRVAKSLGKKVIITSDMYLDRVSIERILKKNNITNYDKLYLSSDLGLKKHEGHLYTHLLDDLGAKPDSILHVGDNEHGDIAAAKAKGIKTLFTQRTLELLYKNKPSRELFYNNRNKASLSESICLGLIANKVYDDPKESYFGDTIYHGSVFNLGYAGLGWMFFSYAKWILEQAIEDGITDLYFLARDGEIVKKVYDAIAPHYEKPPQSHYLLASRRSARVASIKNNSALSQVARSPFYSGTLSQYFTDKLGFDAGLISAENLLNFGFEARGINTVINTNVLKENLYNLTMYLADEIIDNAKIEGELLTQYFVDMGLKNTEKKVAVVDIGYAGTMQDAMTSLLNRDVGGYYLMTFESALKLKKINR